MKQIGILAVLLLLFSGCALAEEKKEATVGLLLTHPIEDQEWNQQGYQGALQLESELEAEIHVRENIRTFEEVSEAVEELAAEGVNLLFGHSSLYADMFMNLKDEYPEIHFVTFNESTTGENITSVNFEGYAMGYFAGMLAAETSPRGHIAAIGAYPYQPEVQGYAAGAMAHNPEIEVTLRFTESWVDKEEALLLFDELRKDGADVFYPAGDGFHKDIIEKTEDAGLYAIGYISDQYELGEETVLTSTMQHVEQVYLMVGENFISGTLEAGSLSFDFQDDAISLGTFSDAVPENTRRWLENAVEAYKETGLLPHEEETEEG
ncbi:BMP family ABC transporter substrate-binding protein [Alkalicoccus daliensis]|uniref:BMP family ABC transporter substrate-binding protein n=1 Tax=Alkalicoccus daliensis TaxID=745820 RepID=UPI001586AF9F|nr:BMP family ABC transporter substrate-binding protein [Alkalicoccus daliensis]